MLDWSDTQYRFTFGIGSLAITGIMAELWKPVMPLWVMLVVSLLPIVVFVMVKPGELPAGFVRAAHVFASAWYVVSAVVLSVALCVSPKRPHGWMILPVFCAVGLLPALIVAEQPDRESTKA